MNNRQKGDDRERELSDMLEDEYQFAAMPAGGSGGGTSRARPDVLACRSFKDEHGLIDGEPIVLAFESKAWDDGVGYVTKEKVNALRSFATRAGGRAVIGVRPDLRTYDRWQFHFPSELDKTEQSVKVTAEDRPGLTLEEVISRA